jgi:hypothetical protein
MILRLSDNDLFQIFCEVQALKGRRPGKQVKSSEVKQPIDRTHIHGFGSFRGLLDCLVEQFHWSREAMAIPAALAVFARPAASTTCEISQIKKAITAVKGFIGASEPTRHHIADGSSLINKALEALDKNLPESAKEHLAKARNLLKSSASLDAACTALDEALQFLEREDGKKSAILAKEALNALPKNPLAYDPDRAWEFAMAWLLGASGRTIDWEADDWAGPMDAWATLCGIVLDSVTATCLHLGGPIGGPNFTALLDADQAKADQTNKSRRGPGKDQEKCRWQPRGERVPHFRDFVGTDQYANWAKQICEALTGKDEARCLCSELHTLYLANPEKAKSEAIRDAKNRGVEKVERLAAGNARARIRTHYSWHDLSAWDGVYPLFPFLMRAVRGGFKEIEPKQVSAGMLGYLLRQDLKWNEVLVAVKRCPSCGEKDVASLNLKLCEQCKAPFGDETRPVVQPMSILLGKGGGFRREEVRVCSDKLCGIVFPESRENCPACCKKPNQRPFFAYFFENDVEHHGELDAVVDPRDFPWIKEVVRILREQGVHDFSRSLPLPSPVFLADIPGMPNNQEVTQTIWEAWGPYLADIAVCLRNSDSETG